MDKPALKLLAACFSFESISGDVARARVKNARRGIRVEMSAREGKLIFYHLAQVPLTHTAIFACLRVRLTLRAR